MKTEIIETGSSGNSFLFGQEVIIDDEPIFTGTLVIDMGLPFSRVKDKVDFQKVTHILLTHGHHDHFQKTTLSKVFNDYPHIIFVCGEWLHEKLRLVFGGDIERIEVIEMNQSLQCGEFTIWGFNAIHDVPNCGYRLLDSDGHKHFHVTDIGTLKTEDEDGNEFFYLDAVNYDTATIECNYEDGKAKELINQANENDDFSHLSKAIRNHLSVYEVIEFCKENSIGELTPVHIGNSTKKEVYQALEAW